MFDVWRLAVVYFFSLIKDGDALVETTFSFDILFLNFPRNIKINSSR